MTSNYSTIEVEAKEKECKNETSHSIFLAFLLHFITFTNLCKLHIQMTSICRTVEVKAEERV